MDLDILNNHIYAKGGLTVAESFSAPSGSITNAMIVAAAGISASKLQRRITVRVSQMSGLPADSGSWIVHVCRGTGTLQALECVVDTLGVSDASLAVDLRKSTGGAAFASVLTADVDMSTQAVRTVVAGTFDDDELVDGDILQIVIQASPNAGTLPQGLCVVLTLDEAAQ